MDANHTICHSIHCPQELAAKLKTIYIVQDAATSQVDKDLTKGWAHKSLCSFLWRARRLQHCRCQVIPQLGKLRLEQSKLVSQQCLRCWTLSCSQYLHELVGVPVPCTEKRVKLLFGSCCITTKQQVS